MKHFRQIPRIYVEEYQNQGDVKYVYIPNGHVIFNGRVSKLEQKHKRLISGLEKTFTKPYCLIYKT